MKSIQPSSSSPTWLARAGSGILAAAACLFLMATFASPVQAQVTYRPDLAGSDFSTLSTNGTATILYSLQGAPADSPYGSSFSLTFSLSPLGGSGTPLSYGTFLPSAPSASASNNYAALLLRIPISSTNLQASDLVQVPNVSNAPQQAFDDELSQYYSFTYTTGALQAAPNWSLTSGMISSYSTASNISTSPGTVSGIIGLQDSNGNSLATMSPTGFGTTTTVNPYFVFDGPTAANAVNTSHFVNLRSLISFQSLTFTPVPEPGGAFLMAAAGLWFIVRRRRIC